MPPPDPERGADPEPVGLRHECVDDRRALGTGQRFDLPAPAREPRQAGVGPGPNGAVRIHRQRQHRVRRQALRLRLVLHAPGAIDAGDAGIVGPDPDGVALHRQRPHFIAGQPVGLAQRGEATSLRIEDGDADALHRHPDAVARIHRKRLDVVPRQAAGVAGYVPPDPHPHAVVAGEAIRGRDPQVARVVTGQRPDLGGRQALRGPGDPEARPLRHPREHAGAGQPQPHRDPSPMPHVPSPPAC